MMNKEFQMLKFFHPPSQEAMASRPWRNSDVLRSLGEGGLELRRVTPYCICHGFLPVGLHFKIQYSLFDIQYSGLSFRYSDFWLLSSMARRSLLAEAADSFTKPKPV
jgi:hypothetical protein